MSLVVVCRLTSRGSAAGQDDDRAPEARTEMPTPDSSNRLLDRPPTKVGKPQDDSGYNASQGTNGQQD